MNDGGGCREAGLDPALAGGETEAEGDMGLAHARGAESDDVLSAADELSAGQIQHQLLVQLRDRVEVEALQALGGGKFTALIRRSIRRASRSSMNRSGSAGG